MTRSGSALELLERALAYTRGTLATVREVDLGRRTPCADWDLRALLAHMDDALDAFTAGAAGAVPLRPTTPATVRVERLQAKACALLGAWSAGPAPVVELGGLLVATDVVARTAALEITVHGWDVGAATGRGSDLPGALAADLLPAAAVLVDDADRGTRFGRPVAVEPSAPPGRRLLAHLGRRY